MDLSVLIEPTVDLARLHEVLDGLGHEGRVHAVRAWTKKQQASIYEAVKGHMPLDLDFLVPAGVPPLTEVIHQGHNSMPMHRHFQKRFAKAEPGPTGEATVIGYNEQTLKVFSGPGYFVVTKGEGEHEGELVIDCTKLPTTKPTSWPPIVPSGGLIPAIVYGNLQDYVRGIATHVSIGRARKNGKPIDNWFVLVRKDEPS